MARVTLTPSARVGPSGDPQFTRRAGGLVFYPGPCSFAGSLRVGSLFWPLPPPTVTLPPLRGGPLPPVACQEGRRPALFRPFQGSVDLGRLPAPGVRPEVRRGGGGPTLCLPVSCSPVLPLCWGTWGILCHRLHKDFSQTNIQGFLSCRAGRRWLPALARLLLQTKHLGVCGQSWHLLASRCSPGPRAALQWGLVPRQHLPGFSSGLPPAPRAVDRRGLGGRSPQSLSGQTIPQGTVASRPREAWVPPASPTARSPHCALAACALLTTPPSAPQGRQPPSHPQEKTVPAGGEEGPGSTAGTRGAQAEELAPPPPHPTATVLLGSTHHCVGFFHK